MPASQLEENPIEMATTKSIQAAEPLQRDDTFYLDYVVFLVEDTLFKVPRIRFELDSKVFSSMFSLPSAGTAEEGIDEKSPIKLEGIQKGDFRNLLRAIYPNLVPGGSDLSQDDLLSIVHLSTMWEFKEVRKVAVAKLSEKPMNAIQKILLARKAMVSQWLLSGYVELVSTAEPLSLEKNGTLGWETIARLLSVQQQRPEFWKAQIVNHKYRLYCANGDHHIDVTSSNLQPLVCNKSDEEKLVKEAFQAELMAIQAWEAEWEEK